MIIFIEYGLQSELHNKGLPGRTAYYFRTQGHSCTYRTDPVQVMSYALYNTFKSTTYILPTLRVSERSGVSLTQSWKPFY